jgi:transposase
MSRYLPYSPEQGVLIPSDAREALGSDHLCFFVHDVVERLDLGRYLEAYGAEGGVLYHPSLMLKVWLYAYALAVTSSRRLEQRIREDLAFRYLAGGARPDYWALNAFRRRHGRAINDSFTQVVELARRMGLRQLGTVAIDATRIKASASPDRIVKDKVVKQKVVKEKALKPRALKRARAERLQTRLKVRRWQQACDAHDPNENAGSHVHVSLDAVAEMPATLPALPREKTVRRSVTDPDARFLRTRGGFVLGYTAEIAVSDDHLIVAQRVTQAATDNESLAPMVELIGQVCGQSPGQVVADSGFYSNRNVERMEQAGVQAFIPDSNLARELNLGLPPDDTRCRDPRLKRMRERMRSEQGRTLYRRRKALVEPVFGVLKEQRNLRAFRTRSLHNVANEFALAAIAYNLTRLHKA